MNGERERRIEAETERVMSQVDQIHADARRTLITDTLEADADPDAIDALLDAGERQYQQSKTELRRQLTAWLRTEAADC